MNWYRITTLLLFDLRHSIFAIKGLVFLIPFFLFWCLFLYSLKDGAASWLSSNEGMLIATRVFDFDTAKSLFLYHSPTLSLFFILAITMMPVFVILGANDQVASDSARGPLRFLLTRCTRNEIFLARFLSALTLIGSAFCIITLMATMIALTTDINTAPAIIHYGIQTGLTLIVYVTPFVAFMSIISAFTSSALGSLLTGFSLYCLLLGIIVYYKANFPIIAFLLPSAIKKYLYSTDLQLFVFAVCSLLLYTLIYSFLGWLLFRKRNL
jgi:hypothetical protein